MPLVIISMVEPATYLHKDRASIETKCPTVVTVLSQEISLPLNAS